MMKNLFTIALIAGALSLMGQSKNKAKTFNSDGIIQSSPLVQKSVFKKLCTGADLGLSNTILKCKNDSLFLFADTSFVSYLWSNGSETNKDTIINDGIYWLSVTDTLGCISVDSVKVIQVDLNVSPKDTSICSSDSIQMNVKLSPNIPSLSCGLSNKRCYGASNDYVLGNGTNTTTLTTPYRGYYRNAKNQYLILASELKSMGLSAGAINSIAFNIYDKKSWFAYENFSISIGCTQENELLSWQNGLFKVFDTSYTTSLGWNTHHFDQSYNWDGLSNIIIEVCYFTTTQPAVDYDDVYYTITPFSSVISNWNDNIINACDDTDSVLYVARPNMQFNICEEPGLFSYTFDWRPSNILSDTSIVNPICFTNSSADVIVALNSNRCSIEDTAHININPKLNFNLGNDTLVCNQDTFEIDAGIFQSYLWSDSSTNNTLDVLSSGIYSVTVTDSFNCQGVDSINVNKSQTLNLIKTSTNITCHGDSNGTASVAVSGGASPYLYVWSNGATNSSVSSLSNAYYYVTVSDSNYCSINDSIFIDEPKVFSSTITATNIPCNGANTGSASINVSGGKSPHTFYWSNGVPDTLIQNLNAGNYQVTITDDNLCIYYDSILITQSDSINIANTITQPLCHGDSNGAILSSITGGNPTYTYQWNNGVTNKDLFNIGAGVYIVTITDQNACTDSFEVNLNEPSILSSQSTITNNYCDQNNGSISCVGTGGSPPFSYQWSNPSQTFLAHGIYHVTITDSNACSRVDSMMIDSIGWPNTDFSYNDICEGESVVMTGIDNGHNISSWIWDIGNGMQIMSGPQISQHFYNDTSISVQLIAQDIHGCEDTTLHNINIYPVPVVNFSSDTLWGCEELIVQFNDESIYDSVQRYDWIFEGHGNDSIKDPVISFNTVGSWNITLKLTSIHGCESEIQKDQHITIYPNPISNFSLNPTETDILNPEVTFTNTSLDDVSWTWDFGDGNNSIQENPIHTYEDTGHYTMILTVSSINGCIDTSMNNIHIKKGFRIFIPNSFTPNNDGINDMFGPVGTFGAVSEYNLFIYNRWGEILFESNDPYSHWNGKYKKTDKSVPLGNYVYFIKIIDEYGELFSYKGNIVIARNYFD